MDEIIMHLLHLDDIQLPTLSTLVKGAKVEVVKIEFWKSLGIGRSCNRRILLRMTFGCISFNILFFGGRFHQIVNSHRIP